MRLYLVDPDQETETEISNVKYLTPVSKSASGGGVVRLRVRAFENQGAGSWNALLWSAIEIRKNDGSSVLWEGFITVVNTKRNYVYFTCREGLWVLDDVPVEYNSVYATGRITAVSTTVVTDSKKNYTVDALIGKLIKFTDFSGIETEFIYPNASTAYIGSPDYNNGGNYLNLVGDGSYMKCWDGNATSPGGADTFGIQFEWTVPNYATSTRIVISLRLWSHPYFVPGGQATGTRYYTAEEEYPLITIYDNNSSTWKSSVSGIVGIGRVSPALSGEYFWRTIIITENVENYFNGSGVLKLRVVDGDPMNTLIMPNSPYHYRIGCGSAQLINNYSETFEAAETTITITDNTATTITVDVNVENLGINAGDYYSIGETYSGTIESLFEETGLGTWLTVDVDASTGEEARDLTYAYVGDLLRDIALKLGRKLWQAVGWEIKLKDPTNYVDSEIDLTEADLVNDDWDYESNGEKLAHKVIVSGAGAKAIAFADTDYNTPLGIIVNDPTVTDQTSAQELADQIASSCGDPISTFYCLIDIDSGITNIASLDVGVLIDVDIYSSSLVLSQMFVRQIDYIQEAGGGHLFARLWLEVV